MFDIDFGKQGWRSEAACRGVDPNIFFPDKGDKVGGAAAKAFCDRCSVVADCLDWALDEWRDDGGILGGKTGHERRSLRRERRRVS